MTKKTDEIQKIESIINTINEAYTFLSNSEKQNTPLFLAAQDIIQMQEKATKNWRNAELTARIITEPTKELMVEIEKWKTITKMFNSRTTAFKSFLEAPESVRLEIIKTLSPVCESFQNLKIQQTLQQKKYATRPTTNITIQKGKPNISLINYAKSMHTKVIP